VKVFFNGKVESVSILKVDGNCKRVRVCVSVQSGTKSALTFENPPYLFNGKKSTFFTSKAPEPAIEYNKI